MKALVLSGGSGTRLRPITHTLPKQLVPVGNKPVLFHALEAIASAGVTETGLVVGDTHEQIEAAVGDGSAFGLKVEYLRQEKPLGLAHAVRIARDFLADDDFIMQLGDNFMSDPVRGFVKRFEQDRPAAQVLLSRVEDPRRFGVAQVTEIGHISHIEEKPRYPSSDLAVIGFYMFTPEIHRAVAGISPSTRGEFEITDAIRWLIDHGMNAKAEIITGYWKDTGNVPDMLEVNRRVLHGIQHRNEGLVVDSEIVGPVDIGPGARVTGSVITGPAAIGAGATVEHCRIGPFASISDRCRITDSSIRDSIVMPGASVSGVRPLESSLIGRHAEVARADAAAAAHRLVLGDRSSVQVEVAS